jgi:hypothetical protein
VEEFCREGVSGLGMPLETSLVGVTVPLLVPAVFDALSLTPSRVENIRVRRFVIEGFSGASLDCAPEDSRCGAAPPLAATPSMLGAALPFGLVAGLDSEDPEIEEATEPGAEGSGFSARILGLFADMAGLSRFALVGRQMFEDKADDPRSACGQGPARVVIMGTES